MRPGFRVHALRPESLAGWLFADLLLVLFVIGLGSQITRIPASQAISDGTRTKAEKVRKSGMRTSPVKITVPARTAALIGPDGAARNQARRDFVKELRREMRSPRIARQTEGYKAAVNLVFGQTIGDPEKGQRLARAVVPLLPKATPKIFTGSRSKDLWDGGGQNSVVLWVYLYAK